MSQPMTVLGPDESPLQKCLCLPVCIPPPNSISLDNLLRRNESHHWSTEITTWQEQMHRAVWHSPHPHSGFLQHLCNTTALVANNCRFQVTQANKNNKQVLKHTNLLGLFLGQIHPLTEVQKGFQRSLTMLFSLALEKSQSAHISVALEEYHYCFYLYKTKLFRMYFERYYFKFIWSLSDTLQIYSNLKQCLKLK